MEGIGLTLYLTLALLGVLQTVLMVLHTWENRRFARRRMQELPARRTTGRIALFAPCKGVDLGLEANLRALVRQDCDNYEVTFIVESADDPACPIIHRVMRENPHVECRLLVAGRATTTGQKVHNLRVATAEIRPNVEYLAFVDSDARPRREWLRTLVAHLDRPRVGAATGYRWLIPTRRTLANYLLYSMNSSVALLLGRGGRHLVWGGSWAIRKDLFESLAINACWDGTVSDDLAVSRVLHQRHLNIVFEPPCMVASPLDETFGEMLRFHRRQYVLCRHYMPHYWAMAMLGSTCSMMTWAASLAMAVSLGLHHSPLLWLPTATCVVMYALSVFRNRVSQSLVGVYFPALDRALRRPRQFSTWAGPMVEAINCAGLIGTVLGRRICWRGVHYLLGRGGQIQCLDRNLPPPQSVFHNKTGADSAIVPIKQNVPCRRAG